MGSPDWYVSMFSIHLRRETLVQVSTALDMPEWREMTEQTDWREKQPSQVACVSEDLKCWGTWDTTCEYKAIDITPSIAWRRQA